MSTDPLVPTSAAASRLSTTLGRLTLSAGRYPFRRQVGFVGREQSRKRGGRRFKVHRPDGVVLDAWFSPAPRKTLPLQDDMPEPGRRGRGVRLPVVMAHGLMETKERHFKRAWNLNARGHDVVLFDHRGHGGSTFRSLTFGVEEKHDMAAVIDEAQRRGLIPGGGKVLTMGFSLGGGTVLQHAAIDDRVAGVIALAPFADFRGAIESFRRTLAPWVNRDWLNAGFESACDEAGFHLDEASAVEAFRQIDVPVLLAEGGQDPFLPGVDHVHRLAAAKPDGELVLVRIDEASHNALVRKTWPKLELAIGRFARVVSEAEGVVRSQESVVGSR